MQNWKNKDMLGQFVRDTEPVSKQGEVTKLWNVRPILIPVVVGALGMVTNRLEGFIRKIGVDVSVGLLEKACLLGTVRILRRVHEA